MNGDICAIDLPKKPERLPFPMRPLEIKADGRTSAQMGSACTQWHGSLGLFPLARQQAEETRLCYNRLQSHLFLEMDSGLDSLLDHLPHTLESMFGNQVLEMIRGVHAFPPFTFPSVNSPCGRAIIRPMMSNE